VGRPQGRRPVLHARRPERPPPRPLALRHRRAHRRQGARVAAGVPLLRPRHLPPGRDGDDGRDREGARLVPAAQASRWS
jgi:hypothetical protein